MVYTMAAVNVMTAILNAVSAPVLLAPFPYMLVVYLSWRHYLQHLENMEAIRRASSRSVPDVMQWITKGRKRRRRRARRLAP